MGYPTVSDFDKQFVQRTLDNLNVEVPNTYTHLLNCLLGLILLPRQWNEQGKRNTKFYKTKLVDEPDLLFLNSKAYISDEYSQEMEVQKLDHKHMSFENIRIKELINRIRHAIAHQSLRPTSSGDEWAGIIMRSYSHDSKVAKWGNSYEVQMYFTMDELKAFAVFIAKNYLDELA
jgi:hypothetical protein